MFHKLNLKSFLFAVGLIVVISVVVFVGTNKAEVKENEFNQQMQAYENEKEASSKEKEELIKTTWLGKNKPRIYIIGSSVAAGAGASDPNKTSWAGLLYASFKETNPDIEFSNLAVGGYSTSDILENNILDKIKNPDVVIFETSLLNNFKKVTITESNSQIEEIYTVIREKYPETKIILMPPNLTNEVDSTMDSEGNTLREYVDASKAFIENKDWEYIDYWSNYEQKISEANLNIEDTLSDGIHPNDTGYEIWFDSIKGYFNIN